jgi:hypothetical protein
MVRLVQCPLSVALPLAVTATTALHVLHREDVVTAVAELGQHYLPGLREGNVISASFRSVSSHSAISPSNACW